MRATAATHADKITCPGNDTDLAEKRVMQEGVRSQHEMLNGWLKNWGILSQSQVFHHHISLHGDVFRACAVVTQLTVERGELLFEAELEYED
jgi:hypothetical protein